MFNLALSFLAAMSKRELCDGLCYFSLNDKEEKFIKRDHVFFMELNP